jgi:N utilization substance protein A
MKSDFIIALTQLAAERNLPREIVLEAIEAALASAYKRDSIAVGQNISVTLDPGDGSVSVYIVKTVAEVVEDPEIEISLADAQKIKADAEIGDEVPTENLEHTGGRIAAQTAKQVVIQRLREAERELVFKEFADKEGEVFTVTVQKIESKQVVVELGRAEAILPPGEQAAFERYRVGQRMKVLLQSIRQSVKGPEIIVSRTDQILLRRLFEMEVPEIYNGSVEIKDIAREAGSRSKVAVFAKQDGVDAVGSCVGLRGIRIQNIVNELHGEKIDVVQWQKESGQYIARALGPSTVMRVEMNEADKSAIAVVPDHQLSLAIGKEGQNARLAAKLTGWRVDIKSNVEMEALEAAAEAAKPKVTKKAKAAVAKAETEAVAEAVIAEAEEVVAAVDETAEEAEAPVVEEAPVAEAAPEEAAAVEEEPAEEVPVEEEAPEEVLEEIPFEPLLAEAEVQVPVAAAEPSALIKDLPAEVWSVRTSQSQDAGVIRFREDIQELGGPAGPRRGGGGRRRGGGGRSRTAKRR